LFRFDDWSLHLFLFDINLFESSLYSTLTLNYRIRNNLQPSFIVKGNKLKIKSLTSLIQEADLPTRQPGNISQRAAEQGEEPPLIQAEQHQQGKQEAG
jgi:hypothetical protein